MGTPQPLDHALALLLRSRPVTTKDAAESLGLSLDETRECLARLVDAQHLVWEDDVLGYQSPERRAISAVGDHLASVRDGLRDVEAVLAGLPRLVESWSAGASGSEDHVIEILRGPVPIGEVWTRQLTWRPPTRVSMFMPEVLGAADVGQDIDAAAEYLRETGLDLRAVVGSAAADGADPAELYAGVAPGTQLRVHPLVPSWMMVTDETLVVPAQWGRADLVDLVMIAYPPLSRAMTDFFDLIWEQAVPVAGWGWPSGRPEWDPLLRLLQRGITVEAAGRALGLSPRTAQRRIRSAMRHYGVESQFALGAAWMRHTAVD
ncbi:AsnC family protein [Nocardioides sp. LHD-245]|uniref:AsnC family protein n=1 Tax=Nocardioides sp. LHD-245 TaxID=3051387 RepID=UPI0027DF10A7|nr:AsnC family protein [Nocardioides sp. LHD-245]